MTIARNPNFRGIILFDAENSADLADNPDLAGINLVYYWSQIEPQPGQYQWNIIDQDIQAWQARGKKVMLRLVAAGWRSWDKPWSQHGTPQWVYDLGVKSVTELDGAVLPQYWNPIFLAHYDHLIKAFAQHYDGNPAVSVVQMAIGDGGEPKVDTRNDNPNKLKIWESIGYTDPIWHTTVLHIMNTYDQAFHHTPMTVMPDATFIGGTPGYNQMVILNYAVQYGIGLQNNGMVKGQVLRSRWLQVPFVVSEQRDRTAQSGDTLAEDLNTGMQQQARYILIFKADIIAPGAQSVLHEFATQAIAS